MKKNEFRNKKILIMGLGILGRGVNVARFLAGQGAKLTITDLKTKEDLASSLKKLKKIKNIKYVLGRHNLSDFRSMDMVIKAAGVPYDSPCIKEAKKNKIPVEMDASLFAKLTEEVTILGITGTRGKSTITHLIFEIIKNSGRRVFLGGNIKGLATLPLLKKIKSGDIIVMELDSWQLQGFGGAKISPHIAVFNNFMRDHMNYYKGDMRKYFRDKANIFKNQKEGNFLVVGEKFFDDIKKMNLYSEFLKLREKSGSEIFIAQNDNSLKTKLLGRHNVWNIAVAAAACRLLGVSEKIIKKTIADFSGVPGRMEFIREASGVRYYNDTTSTTPDGVMAAIEALKKYKGKIILIAGGADKKLDYGNMAKAINKNVKRLILFPGVATDKILKENIRPRVIDMAGNMKEAVGMAKNLCKRGDIVLLSPGAASFGLFKNEFDRGNQFRKIVKKL